jgi:acyl-CoA dehydrogenase
MRKAVNDAMDIQGGAGICLGPHNMFGKVYQAIPISITVEGANILTRSLIVYGQGAIRCHPYVLKEMMAAQNTDQKQASQEFDGAISGHIAFAMANFMRSLVLGLTNSRFALVPMSGPTERYYQHISRLSAAFAFVSDVAMISLGGALKRKEKLSGRLADILGLLYLASASLKRFEDDGHPAEDLPLVKWALEDCLFQIQEALFGIFQNFPNRLIGRFLQLVIFPMGRRFSPPSDDLGRTVARLQLSPSATRDRLTHGIFVPASDKEQVGRLEKALLQVDEVDKIEKRVLKAHKEGQIEGYDIEILSDAAVKKGIIDATESEKLKEYNRLRREIITVDDFAPNEFRIRN